VARTAHARALLDRHNLGLILSIRFLYGLRIAGPVAIGMSEVLWLLWWLWAHVRHAVQR
jgi:membrane protein DedA with SNARE-associated domain